MGYPPISTIGLGLRLVSSLKRDPSPPAKMSTFIYALRKNQKSVLSIYTDYSILQENKYSLYITENISGKSI